VKDLRQPVIPDIMRERLGRVVIYLIVLSLVLWPIVVYL
jgi:hypothetical protein